MTEPEHLVRWVGIGVGIFTLMLMYFKRHVWLEADYTFRIVGVAMLFLHVTAVYGLAEAALMGVPVAPRTFLTLGGIAMTTFAVLKAPPREKPNVQRRAAPD